MIKNKNLINQKFGKLTVIDFSSKITKNKKTRKYWLCKCECGNYKVIEQDHLISGHTRSCGCFKKETISNRFYKHGLTDTRLFRIWTNVKTRCYNKKSKFYKNYGGRGIVICNEWKNNFNSFYNWAMSNGYQDDLTIDRIDVNENYEPSNCRWVDIKTQQRNRGNNYLIKYNGEEHCVTEWGRILGINYGTILYRLKKLKWSIRKAFTEPVKNKKYFKS